MEILVSRYKVDCSTALAKIDSLADHLVKAKGELGHAMCLCTMPARKLIIRSVRNRHFLTVWPHDGHRHHYACPFHRDEEEQLSTGGKSEPAVRELPEGFQIAVDFPLGKVGRTAPLPDSNPGVPNSQAQAVSRTRMGLLGIVHYLWKESRLNQWGSRWTRNWWRVTQALLPVLEQGMLGDQRLTECLYLVPEANRERLNAIQSAWHGFAARLKPGSEGRRFGVILGEAHAIQNSKFGYQLGLKHFDPFLYMTQELRGKLATSYPKAYHRIGGKSGDRVVSICLVELSRSGYLNVIDAALMATSAQYIPIDSSHEAVLAHQLVAEKRSFIKPLTIRAGESALPDFILTDTAPQFVLEVFGMSTQAYIERKAQKMAIYKKEGTPVWSWDAERQPMQIPPLPAPLAALNIAGKGFTS